MPEKLYFYYRQNSIIHICKGNFLTLKAVKVKFYRIRIQKNSNPGI